MLNFIHYLGRALQVVRIALSHVGDILRDRIRRRTRLTGPERLRLALEELSGSFLKFGQILSLQVDSLPREYCDALLNLLDRVPPFPADRVRQVFIEEFGRAPEEIFSEFDYQALASASIGQVHRARLQDGSAVAVKVQRPGIRDLFTRDAVLLQSFVRLVYLLRIRSLYFLSDPVREFSSWLEDELDYRREAAHAQLLHSNAEQTPSERVPRVHWDLTSERIFTMDFLRGYSVSQYLRLRDAGDEARLAELKAIGFDPSTFVSNVITNFVSDAFRFGVFHADLHPANLLIMEDNAVGYVDFGIVGTLTPAARRKVIELTLSYVRGHTDDLFSTFLSMSKLTRDADVEGFRRELERRSRDWYKEPAVAGIPGLGASLTVAMVDLLNLCRTYGILPNREMIKYIRSLFLADGLVSRLAPGLDLAPQLLRLSENFITQEARGRFLSSEAALSLLVDLSGWLQAGPGAMLRAIDTLEQGQFRVQTHFVDRRQPRGALRLRSLLAAAVWLVLVIYLALSSRRPGFSGEAPFTAAAAILSLWTVWLSLLLRRLWIAGDRS